MAHSWTFSLSLFLSLSLYPRLHGRALSLSLSLSRVGYHKDDPNMGFMGYLFWGEMGYRWSEWVFNCCYCFCFFLFAFFLSYSSSSSFAIWVMIHMCSMSLGSRFRMSLKNLIICIDFLAGFKRTWKRKRVREERGKRKKGRERFKWDKRWKKKIKIIK